MKLRVKENDAKQVIYRWPRVPQVAGGPPFTGRESSRHYRSRKYATETMEDFVGNVAKKFPRQMIWLFPGTTWKVYYRSPVSDFSAMKFLPSLFFIVLTSSMLNTHAVDAYSPVVGFLRFDCPANSDTRVSVPFHPSPRWAGKLSADPADQGNDIVRLSFSRAPAFTGGELTTTPHSLLCRDAAGPEGRHFPIVAHGVSTVDIAAKPADLTGLLQDGLVSVIPDWTIATLFPPATQTTFHPSTGNLASARGSELHLFNATTTGTDLAPSRRFFVTANGWREIRSGYPDAGKTAIAPGQAFIVRHPVDVAATTFVPINQVYGGRVALPVRVTQGERQDTVIALPRPVTLTLSELDLGSVFEESPDPTPANRKDELHLYDNSAPLPETTGQNKTPVAIYFRLAGAWVRDTDPVFPNSDNVPIEPAASLLIRKAAGDDSEPLLWSNAPLYDIAAP